MNSHDLFKEAREITEGKSEEHGPPEDSFGRIAKYWTLYLRFEGTLSEDENISKCDVAEMFELMKLARGQSGQYNRDDYRDRINYVKFANHFRENNE